MRKLLTVLALSPALAAPVLAQVMDLGPVTVPGANFAGPVMNVPLYGGGFGTFINVPIATYKPLDFDLGRVPMFSIQKGIGLAGFRMDVDPLSIGALTVPVSSLSGTSSGGGSGSGAGSGSAATATQVKPASKGIVRILEKLRDRKLDQFDNLEVLSDAERADLGRILTLAADIAIDSKPVKITRAEYNAAEKAYQEAVAGIVAGSSDAKALREASAKLEEARRQREIAAAVREDAVGFITTVGILSLHDLKTRQLAETELNRMRWSLSDISVSAGVAYATFERHRASFAPIPNRDKLADNAIEKYNSVFH